MIKVIRKDILICLKFHLVYILVTIFVVGFLQLDSGDYAFMGLYMALAGGFTYVVAHSCYVDDKGMSVFWLKSLPVSPKKFIDSKYVLTILATLEGLFLFTLTNYLISIFKNSTYALFINLLPIMLIFHIIYCSLYLFLYFKYGYSIAQYSILFMLIFLAFTKMVGSKKFFDLSSLQLDNIVYIVLIIAIFIFILSWIYSRRKVSNAS